MQLSKVIKSRLDDVLDQEKRAEEERCKDGEYHVAWPRLASALPRGHCPRHRSLR